MAGCDEPHVAGNPRASTGESSAEARLQESAAFASAGRREKAAILQAGAERFRSVLGSAPNTPAAWLALTRALTVQGDLEGAADASEEAVARCPDAPWLWTRHVQMLDTLGRRERLQHHLKARQAPPAAATPEFIGWAKLMTAVDAHDLVRDALQAGPPDALRALAATDEGSAILVELATTAGEPSQAVELLWQDMLRHPEDAGVWRRLFDLALWTGDAPLAEAMAGKLHRSEPRNHGGLPMFLLHDARLFRGAMQRIRSANAVAPEERLAHLSRIVVDEPACLPAAFAWTNQFAAELRRRPMSRAASTRIPRRLVHAEPANENWRAHHEQYEWLDLAEAAGTNRVLEWLPPGTAARVSRLPRSVRLDVIRLGLLRAIGGWFVTPTMHCGAPVERLAAGADLVLSLNENGHIATAHMGSTAHHPAIDAALQVALTVLDELIARDNASPITTGMPAMTLGLATALAPAVLCGAPLHGVALTTPIQRWRRLGLWWPK